MSAEPIDVFVAARPDPWSPDPVMQKFALHTIEDVLNLPSGAPASNSVTES
ncbi:hypothetical protein [Actinoplanes sp. NPDC051851]|uniref:hypothetical protein n=1 Tax=Actinoplanes sp. NPDC051851 TaxID=3154753 RepID=UPI00342DC76D